MNGLESLLKSLGPEDPEWLKKSQKIWETLDDLAAKDPIEYKNFIQTAQREAQNSRLVKPGWGIQTWIKSGDYFKKVYINLGISERISPPSSLDLNNVSVPLIVGTPRNFENTKVLDIVYHSSVLKKTMQDSSYFNAILDLSWGACKEILDWEVVTSHGIETKKDLYYGRYGWDDKGSPISDELKSEIVFKEQVEESASLNLEDLKDNQEQVGLIQEIKVEKKEPMYKIITESEILKILVYLPQINSGKEANVQLKDSNLSVETESDYLSLELADLKNVLSAEFSKKSGILKIVLQK